MAVIIDMDMPKSCMDCPLIYFDYGDDAYFGVNERRCVIDGSCIDGMGSERAYDCPLKPADEMIKEIEEMRAWGDTFGNVYLPYDKVKEIIHKYTDKEQT